MGANKIVSIGMRIGPPVSYTEIITANTNDDKNTTEEKMI